MNLVVVLALLGKLYSPLDEGNVIEPPACLSVEGDGSVPHRTFDHTDLINELQSCLVVPHQGLVLDLLYHVVPESVQLLNYCCPSVSRGPDSLLNEHNSFFELIHLNSHLKLLGGVNEEATELQSGLSLKRTVSDMSLSRACKPQLLSLKQIHCVA